MRSATITAVVLSLALVAGWATPQAASAQAAAPDDRCTGTFCDFYYGGPPAAPSPGAPQANAAPTPLTVPGNGFLGRMFGGSPGQAPAPGSAAPATPAKPPLVAVQGGGIIGMVRGDQTERCGGSLCDFYYGSPSPEEEREAHPAEAAALPETSPTEAAAAPGVAYQTRSEARHAAAAERREKALCAATGSDPWQCYR